MAGVSLLIWLRLYVSMPSAFPVFKERIFLFAMNIYASSDHAPGNGGLKYNACADEILPESNTIKIWRNA